MKQVVIRRITDPAFDGYSVVWMEYIANGAVIEDHDLAQVRFNLRQILNIRPVTERAMLPVVPPCKVFTLDFQPVDNRIGVLLDRRSEYN